ncbi:hypothetical protein UlMin_042872 [Ulmus minor]
MARFCDLPEELVLEILSNLPAKCVGRFRCVQRSWNVLMNEQRFVAKHLEKNSNSKQSLFMMHCFQCKASIENDFRTICNSNSNGDEMEIEIEHMEALIPNAKRRLSNYIRSSHCNGIICMSGLSIPIVVLLNPALRRFKSIRLEPRKELMFGLGWQLVGFGHDSIDNVYKLVRVSADRTKRDAFLDVEVGTLGTLRTKRRRKKTRFPFRSFIFCINPWKIQPYYSHLYCKGVYYWVTPFDELDESEEFDESEVILSFDMHDEELKMITLPVDDNLANIAGVPCKISVMLAPWNHDSVALFRFRESGDEAIIRPILPMPIEMWLMHRDHAHGTTTWTKHLTIPPLDKPYHPIQLWNNDELILMTQTHFRFGGNSLASYNLLTHRFRTLPSNSDLDVSTNALAYVKTLEFF